ncbi:MAG: DMT family protein [Planctomycetota bacterium]|nr:DMT family protein [Planctomycetota bacterium]
MMTTVCLLLASNIFMTWAWYGHLRHRDMPIMLAVLASWGIAFFEYCLMVPANRIGHRSGIGAPTLKIIQEAITLLVFAGFSTWWLGEPLRWRHYAAFGLVFVAVLICVIPWGGPDPVK